jgi:hypothetical protein
MAKTKLGSAIKKAQNFFKKSNFNLLNNKYLLYFVLILSICDLLLFAYLGDFWFIIIFVLIGLITSFFSKNMIVILTMAVALTNIIKFGAHITSKEGMENASTEEQVDEVIKSKVEGLGEKEKQFLIDSFEGKIEGLSFTGPKQQVYEKMQNFAVQEKKEAASNIKESMKNRESMNSKKESMNSKKESMNSKKESMNSKKESMNSKKESMNDKKEPLKVQGYDLPLTKRQELQQETMKLLSTQEQLISNMKNLEPMLTQAEDFMKQFEAAKLKAAK